MCHDSNTRAYTFALVHLLFSAFSWISILPLFDPIIDYGDSCAKYVYIYFGICLLWSLSEFICLVGLSDKKKEILKCHFYISITTLLLSNPYFIVMMYFVMFEKIKHSEGKYDYEILKVLLPTLTIIGIILDIFSSINVFIVCKKFSSRGNTDQRENNIIQLNVHRNEEALDRMETIQILEKQLSEKNKECEEKEKLIKEMAEMIDKQK